MYVIMCICKRYTGLAKMFRLRVLCLFLIMVISLGKQFFVDVLGWCRRQMQMLRETSASAHDFIETQKNVIIPFVRFEIFAVVTIMMTFFCVLVPCGLVGRCRHFCLHFQGWIDNAGNQRGCIGWQKGKYEGMGHSEQNELEIELGPCGDSKQTSLQ